MVTNQPMSDFKFACPVCGQHITADPSSSGGQIECPTCFQKIVVPQAPASAETKFILSASQVAKPRPTSAGAAQPAQVARPSAVRRTVSVIALLLVCACAAGAALYVFRDRVFRLIRPETALAKLPPNVSWSLDLRNAAFPETKAAGRVHGLRFEPEQATLEGGTFSLRQGKGWPPELGITILLRGRRGEDFASKRVEVTADQVPPVPRVVLRWKDEQRQPGKQDIASGYALKLAFGQVAHGHLPGQIYLCLPDEAKSVVAGTFEATLRKPKPPRPQAPKAKK